MFKPDSSKGFAAARARRHEQAGWRRSARLVGGIWLLALALLLLQFVLPESDGREAVQMALFVVLIYLALPSGLLLLADWLQRRFKGRAGSLAAYFLFVAAVAGLGGLIQSLLLQPVPLLPLKLVIFIHLLLALGWLFSTLAGWLAVALMRLYAKAAGREPGAVLRPLLALLGFAFLSQLVRLLRAWLPLDDWLNFLWLFRF